MCPSARNLTPNKRTSRANNNDLSENTGFELEELAEIYMRRGVDRALARLVAQYLMAKDASAAHAHDELGISDVTTAGPVQAALTFAVGAPYPCSWSSYRACPHRFSPRHWAFSLFWPRSEQGRVAQTSSEPRRE